MMNEDYEGHDAYMDELKAAHQKPEGRTPLAADGVRWQDYVDDDDDTPAPTPTLMSILSNTAFVQMQQMTIAGQAGAIERLNTRIAELEAAIEAMVQAAYETSYQTLVHRIIDIGRGALGK